MKSILFAFLLWGVSAFGANAKIDCGSTSITTTYSTSSPHLHANLKNFSLTTATPHIAVINGSAVRICVNTASGTPVTAPTAGNGNEHCVPANAFLVIDDVNLGSYSSLFNVYVRADGSTCSSGIVDVDVW